MPSHARPLPAFAVPSLFVAAFVVLAVGIGIVSVRSGGDGDGQASSGGGEAATADTTTSVTPAPVPAYPLTGLPAVDPAVAGRPALVVKIDNAEPKSRPQMGLNQADIVIEEKVEGSVTRLAAVFHSTDADSVGPVRSARTTDIAVATPLENPLFAWSGANADFAAVIRSSALVDVGVDAVPAQYERRGDRAAPSNLYSSTTGLYAVAPPGSPPPPLFAYRSDGSGLGAGASPVGSVNITYGLGAGSAPVDYVWDAAGAGFARFQGGTPHVDEAGVQVAPQNVVIQFVDYVDTGYVDVSGAAVPEAALVGEGTAWVLTAGHLIEGRWAKPSVEAVTRYVDSAGTPVAVTPGRTWVALAPTGGASITG